MRIIWFGMLYLHRTARHLQVHHMTKRYAFGKGDRKIVLGPLKVGDWALSVAYSSDGTKLAAGTQEHIIIWNTATGKELLKIEQRAWRIAFTPDGVRLVSGDWKDIRISDAATGDVIKQFDAHTDAFYSLSIAPNGTKFATTSYDKTTRFFDLITLEPIGEPLEHPDAVYSVAFSKDSQLIATGCVDNLVRTWTVPLTESEKESEQKILKKTIPSTQHRPRRAPIQTSRFFDDFDPGRNNRAAITAHHAEGSGIKNIMKRLFSRSSSPQDHAPRPRRIPLWTSLQHEANIALLMPRVENDIWRGRYILLVGKFTLVPQAAARHQQGHPMRSVEPHRNPCRQRVPMVLLQLTDRLPRWTSSMFHTPAALQFSQGASRVYHALDKPVHPLQVPPRLLVPSQPFHWCNLTSRYL
ncbi:WD40-repeat-containing domain protein [Suillus subalutaceus]|uniref:WD40-repeat-containing domain protein n=1 Tax=Suillus subalutaceus TaxID=48586 RepID=UPI001B87978E|nr:WD40-repeat-containing domain protein [Suillus subalutaceus]KAG1863642.1 WD40-repeat-containing domain protein [Suillus subalutaceus]